MLAVNLVARLRAEAMLESVVWTGGRTEAETVLAYLSTFENFPGVESARQLVSDILPIARGRYK